MGGGRKRELGAYKRISCQVQRHLQFFQIHRRCRSGVQILESKEKIKVMQVWLDGWVLKSALFNPKS